ncbi:MAG: Hpt domain-containing protein [Anaerolineae bacterium]|nr:Hpt domain-containing protein [Anaerolineae bacterium]
MRIQNIPPNDPISNISEQPAIDIKMLEQLRLMLGRDTPQMLAGLIENYLEYTPELLTKLRQAIAEGNKEQRSQITCTLKSNSLAFGAVGLCTLCEEVGTNGSTEAMSKLTQIEREYERVKLVLEAEWHRLYEIRLKTDVFFPTGSYKNIGFYPRKSTRG